MSLTPIYLIGVSLFLATEGISFHQNVLSVGVGDNIGVTAGVIGAVQDVSATITGTIRLICFGLKFFIILTIYDLGGARCGSVKRKVEPAPASLSTHILPP